MKNPLLLTSLLAVGLIAMHPAALAWEPAPGTAPMQVLRTATTDATENRLAEAHDKFSWLYERALVEGPGEPGVSSGILLPQWAKLARHYPPALESVRRARDKLAAEAAEGGRKGSVALHALVRVNAELKDPTSTRDAFVRFAARDPVLAESSIMVALPAFLSLQAYSEASQYLKMAFVTAHFERMQAATQRFNTQPAGADIATQRSFQRHVDLQLARVALVLVNAGRRAEAEALVQRFQSLAGADTTSHHMSAALNGVAPPNDD